MRIPARFTALVAESEKTASVQEVGPEFLTEGDVTIRVEWSGVNYKDALAAKPDGKVARISPLVPGIDMAGTIVDPGTSGLTAGAPVLVHGYGTGVSHHGGFSEYARVPAEWVVPLPDTLSARDAMALGTAGFTAALSVIALLDHNITPTSGPVLVTGATGGVGSAAVSILFRLGFDVIASTGSDSAREWLYELGAHEVISRDETSDAAKPLQKERWAAAVDCVGGTTLAYVLSSLKYGGVVAASGNTGGASLPTTVFPFILRGVTLIGIDSVQYDLEARRQVWRRLADDLRPASLTHHATEVTLDGLPKVLDDILEGRTRGHVLVRVGG